MDTGVVLSYAMLCYAIIMFSLETTQLKLKHSNVRLQHSILSVHWLPIAFKSRASVLFLYM